MGFDEPIALQPAKQGIDRSLTYRRKASLAQAESLGGGRMMGPDEVPGIGIVIGLLQDPEGHVIGVMSQA